MRITHQKPTRLNKERITLMLRKTLLTVLTMAGLGLGATTPAALAAGGGEQHVEDFAFSFEGPFGTYDQEQLRRGLKVYTEVCSACHGLRQVAFRTLGDEGGPHYSEEQVKAYAANFEVYDAEIDDFRAAKPTDHFPMSGLEAAPDLSLMAKARAGFHGPHELGINQIIKGMGGPEYIASVLSGYTGKEKEEAGTIYYENTAFPGGWIAMAPPLMDDMVEFDDGHASDLHHASADVAAFLMWTAEPKLPNRKMVGFIGVGFLILLSVLLYLLNKALWAPIKRKE